MRSRKYWHGFGVLDRDTLVDTWESRKVAMVAPLDTY